MKSNYLLAILALWLIGGNASALTVSNVNITDIRVYVGANDYINVWYVIDGNSRVGENPSNSAFTCELWSDSKSVHATALAAMLAGKEVTIDYVDRGEGTYWCLVNIIVVHQ